MKCHRCHLQLDIQGPQTLHGESGDGARAGGRSAADGAPIFGDLVDGQ